MNLKLYNIDLHNATIGADPQPHDRAVVYDLDVQERHPLTGEMKPAAVFWGSLKDAQEFIARAA